MDIRTLQERLVELGFLKALPDGINGPQTRAAIRAAQRWHGLKDDGIVGPKTEAALWPDVPRDKRESPMAIIGAETQSWPRQGGVPAFYGKVGENQTLVWLPYEMRLAWDKRTKIRRISLHQKVAASATRAFEKIAKTYSETERASLGLDLFGGSLNVRKMRGGNAWSMHSWGIAIDFDPARNGLNSTKTAGPNHARLSDPDALPFWQAWEAESWLSLGRARDFDWMHVQAARL